MADKIENLELGHSRQESNKNLIIRITDVHDDKTLETDSPHRHNFYMICLVVKGGGTHVIDFEKIDILPNRLFFIQPEQVHFWQVKPQSTLAVVQFSVDFLTGLIDYSRIPAIHSPTASYVDLPGDTAAFFLYTLKRIETESANNELHSDKIIQANIVILLAEIERLLKYSSIQRDRRNKYTILENYKKLVNDKYKEITTISEFAGLLNISPNYLNIVIRETTGQTAIDLLHKRVVLEAKRLLINQHVDVMQIAFDLGFKDASYFSRFFKRATGQSPTVFRNDNYKMYQHRDD
jgi:AraC-like DNA-binding protein